MRRLGAASPTQASEAWLHSREEKASDGQNDVLIGELLGDTLRRRGPAHPSREIELRGRRGSTQPAARGPKWTLLRHPSPVPARRMHDKIHGPDRGGRRADG